MGFSLGRREKRSSRRYGDLQSMGLISPRPPAPPLPPLWCVLPNGEGAPGLRAGLVHVGDFLVGDQERRLGALLEPPEKDQNSERYTSH